MQIAFLFPGQGVQYTGMGLDLYTHSPEVRKLFELASDMTGIDTKALLFEGSQEVLKETTHAQIAITLVNLSSWLVLIERGIRSNLSAGFSLGEYSALVDCEVLTLEQIFPVVKFRGECMTRAVNELNESTGRSGMSAVLGLSPQKIEEILASAKIPNLFGANYNSPFQTVVAGTAKALDAAESVFKAAGAQKVIPLKVSGPFHCPLLYQAKKDFEEYLKDKDFKDPSKLFFSNVTGKQVITGAQVKEMAVLQMTAPVQWVSEEVSLKEQDVKTVIECGPGKVLSGLWKIFDEQTPCLGAGTLEQIDKLCSLL